MPKRRLIINVAIYAAGFSAMAAVLPWFVFVPLAIVFASAHIFWETRILGRRYQTILDNMRSIQGEPVASVSTIDPEDIDRTIYKTFKEVVNELERKNFQLVEKNIQLLSIKEIGQTLISSLDEAKVVDAVINFLSKGLGYREIFIGIYHDDRAAFNFFTFRDLTRGQAYEETSLPLLEMDGLLQKAIQTHRSLLIRDPEMHPIGTVDGKSLFADSTMNSYVVVPLIKSNATQDCGANKNCILNMNQIEKERVSIERHYQCPGCGRVPILGVLGVTDGFKAARLSKVDLVSVETLAVQISTMLENTRLFLELKQEEGFRNNIINSMMNGLVTVDTEGRIMLANETAVQLTGYTHEELLGKNVVDLITDNRKEGGDNPVLRTLQTGRKSFQREAWMIRKDGRKDPIILNTTFLQDESKVIQGALAVFIDMSRIRRMEEQIMHLDKLAALGRFSSSIAHEIRNPLTGIAAGIQYLKRTGEVAESQQENIDFILDEVKRIDRLIGDLMNVVRVSDLIYQEIDLEDIIMTSVGSVQELAKQKSVKIVTRFPEERRVLNADADRVTQVIINLLKNAVEANRPGGEVTISVSYPADVSDVLFDAVRDFVIIEVKDNGVGLTEDEKRRVFEPFFSKKTGGTGLGLYVTHSIIERHGGYIYVDSGPDEGTVFTVYLPLEQVLHGNSNEIGHSAG